MAEHDLFEPLLNLENQYYKEGYEEGAKDGREAGYIEGKQFGIQTGFQRFVTVGVLQGRSKLWRNETKEQDVDSHHSSHSGHSSTSGTSRTPHDRLVKNLHQLNSTLDSIPVTNKDEDVEVLERALKSAKVKAKVIMSSLKDPHPLNMYDDVLDLKPTEEVIEG